MGALTSKPYAFLSRPWELKNIESVDFFDTFHSSIRYDYRGSEILRVLPALDERINEEWISDKIRFFYDALQKQRIISVWLNANLFLLANQHSVVNFNFISNDKLLLPVSWSLSLEIYEKLIFLAIFAKKNINIFKLTASITDIETFYAFKHFLTKQLNSVFLNSSSILGLNDFRNRFLVDKSYMLSRAKRFFLTYFNPRFELPVLNIKLRNLVSLSKIQVFSFSYNFSSNFEIINLGYSLKYFLDFLKGKQLSSKLIGSKIGSESLFLIGSNNFLNSFSFSQIQALLANLERIKSFLPNFNYFTLNSQPLNISSAEVGATTLLDQISSINKTFDYKSVNFLFNFQNDAYKVISKDYITLYFGSNGETNFNKFDFVFPIAALTETNSTFINLFGLIRKSNLILYPLYPEIRTFPSLLKILETSTERALQLSNSFSLISDINFFKEESFYYDYKSARYLKSDISFDTFKLNYVSSNFSEFNTVSFINDFFLTDSLTRSSQFLSLASKNYFDTTINFN